MLLTTVNCHKYTKIKVSSITKVSYYRNYFGKRNSKQCTIRYYEARRHVDAIEQWFAMNGACRLEGASRRHLAMSENNFGCYNWDVLLATIKWRPRVLLNIL